VIPVEGSFEYNEEDAEEKRRRTKGRKRRKRTQYSGRKGS
jgi:hypothetical protein